MKYFFFHSALIITLCLNSVSVYSQDFVNDSVGVIKNKGIIRFLADTGRFAVTKGPKDLGRFKVPGLRNVASTAPYMHNGMFKTLSEVIAFYNEPTKFVKHPQNVSEDIKPLKLTEQEKQDLEAFLVSLTNEQPIKRFIVKP